MKLLEIVIRVSLYVGLMLLVISIVYWFIRVSDNFNRIANGSDKMVNDLHLMNLHQENQLKLQQQILSLAVQAKSEERKYSRLTRRRDIAALKRMS